MTQLVLSVFFPKQEGIGGGGCRVRNEALWGRIKLGWFGDGERWRLEGTVRGKGVEEQN